MCFSSVCVYCLYVGVGCLSVIPNVANIIVAVYVLLCAVLLLRLTQPTFWVRYALMRILEQHSLAFVVAVVVVVLAVLVVVVVAVSFICSFECSAPGVQLLGSSMLYLMFVLGV